MANSDTKTQPWSADRIILIPFLAEKLRGTKVGDGRDLRQSLSSCDYRVLAFPRRPKSRSDRIRKVTENATLQHFAD